MNHEETVVLLDENNHQVTFEIVATLKIEDIEYAILSPDEEEGVVIFKMDEQHGEKIFENIQDDKEIQEVLKAYEDLEEEKE